VIRVDRQVERGAPIELEREDLPRPQEGEYYAFQLLGLEVEEAGGQRLGRVSEVSSGPANDVLELDTGLALPLVDACIQEVDLERGRILVKSGFAADS
jgi:16S rRNA processing protein RimM